MLVSLSDVVQGSHGLDHAEGICLAPNGRIYVGGEKGQLYEIGADGDPRELLRTDGFALGLAADADSNIYMCDQVHRVVWRIDPSTGRRTTFVKGSETRSMVVPNWGAFDSRGTYYVSDSGGWHEDDGVIWRRSTDGTVEVWDTACAGFPNGLCLSKDERSLFVLESTTPALVEIPILPDGRAGARRVVAELPGTVPDGVAITTDGRFLVACYRPDIVLLVDGNGAVQEVVGDPQGTVLAAPTNAIFAGPDLSRVVVPNLGRWHLSSFDIPGVTGVPLAYPNLPELAG